MVIRISLIELLDSQLVLLCGIQRAGISIVLGQIINRRGIIVFVPEGHVVAVFSQLSLSRAIVGSSDVIPGNGQIGCRNRAFFKYSSADSNSSDTSASAPRLLKNSARA